MRTNYTEIKPCNLKRVPNTLLDPLKSEIIKIVKAIEHVKQFPYEDYFYPFQARKNNFIAVRRFKKESDLWFLYLRNLNRYNRCLCLFSNDKLIKMWNTFLKNPNFGDVERYTGLFNWIVRRFCNIVDYEQSTYSKTQLEKNFLEKRDKVYHFIENPNLLKNKIKENIDFFNMIKCLVSKPDDYEHLWNPFHSDQIVNWDHYVLESKYDNFINELNSILEKVAYWEKDHNSIRNKMVRLLYHPTSRKKNTEIYFAKILYVEFMIRFNKPYYNEISLILEALFGSKYCENDIIKCTKMVRDAFKKVCEDIKTRGVTNYTDDYELYTRIAKSIKSEDSKIKK